MSLLAPLPMAVEGRTASKRPRGEAQSSGSQQQGATAATVTAKREEPNGDDRRGSARKNKGGAYSGKKHKDGVEDLLDLVAKLTLSNTQAVRLVSSACLTTYLLPAKQEVAIKMREAGKDYHESTMSMEPGERSKAGPPHVNAWQALFDVCKRMSEAKSKPLTNYDALVQVVSGAKDKTDAVAQRVKVLKVQKTYQKRNQPEMVRMTISITSDPVIQAVWVDIKEALQDMEAVEKQGCAPRGHLERLIQEALDEE
eukprot:TRINITY_DN121246_c0_g1_i1.p2 TRINITY_DN121246_c0_g1~~TRINITY_DN121246_c0_g1_i1.p2  ORF type:complete len:255 (-),score=84.13 TRINITY_DN121246_c0_g1_i1:8-772(-)